MKIRLSMFLASRQLDGARGALSHAGFQGQALDVSLELLT